MGKVNFFVNADGSEYIPKVKKKKCSKCNVLLPLSEFAFRGGENYRRTECRGCNRKLTNERKRLRKIHGTAPPNYRCPICNRTEEECKGEGSKRSSAFVLDHCHTTGEFRGWLCHSCNRTVGAVEKLKDVNKLMKYLNKTATRKVGKIKS